MFEEIRKLWGGDVCPTPKLGGAVTMSWRTSTIRGLEDQLERPFTPGKVYYYIPETHQMGVIKLNEKD